MIKLELMVPATLIWLKVITRVPSLRSKMLSEFFFKVGCKPRQISIKGQKSCSKPSVCTQSLIKSKLIVLEKKKILREFFKPNFGSLRPLFYLPQRFEYWHNVSVAIFRALHQSWGPLHPNFGKKNSRNIFYQKENTVGIISNKI